MQAASILRVPGAIRNAFADVSFHAAVSARVTGFRTKPVIYPLGGMPLLSWGCGITFEPFIDEGDILTEHRIVIRFHVRELIVIPVFHVSVFAELTFVLRWISLLLTPSSYNCLMYIFSAILITFPLPPLVNGLCLSAKIAAFYSGADNGSAVAVHLCTFGSLFLHFYFTINIRRIPGRMA